MSDRHARERAWLAHPVTLLSLTTLVVNDHVLKAHCPGVVTGKLSDVAGLVLLPPLLAVVLPWRRFRVLGPVLVAGAAFGAVKAIPAAAGLASAVWSTVVGPSVIRADWTDLVALPALGLAVWVGRTARPASRRAGAVVTLVLLPLATLAVAATSAPRYNEAVEVWTVGERVLAGERNAYHSSREPDTWRLSDDGGRTWQRVEEHEYDVDAVRRSPEEARQACAPEAPDRCYRIVDGHLRVEETTDGGASWHVAWEVGDEQRRRLARHYGGIGDVARDLSSRAVAVVPLNGGHAVVVANGRDGYAVRGVTGGWERVGFGSTVLMNGEIYPDDVVPLEPRSLVDVAPETAVGVLACLLALTIAAAAWHWPVRHWPAFAVVPVFGLGGAATVAGAVWFRNTAGDGIALAPMVFGLTLAVLPAGALIVAAVATRLMTPLRAVLVAVAALAGAGAVVAVFLAWAGGGLGYRFAGLAAVGVGVVVLAAATLLVHGRSAVPHTGRR